jgi:hypothetical protein
MERRKAPRLRCNVPCELKVRGKAVVGRVRNVSEGGLAIDAPIASLGDGQALAIRLQPQRRAAIELTALAWHVRASRRPGAPSQLGLVVSKAGDDYFEWLECLRRLAPAGQRPKPPPPALRMRFAVRVAERGSPRSRRILIVAADGEDARARALAEVGAGWEVVSVEPAREPSSGARS